MARCKACGKFGLFLKLNSLGECESCAAKRARQNYLKQGMEAAKEELENLPKTEIVLSGSKLKCRPLCELDDIKFSNITANGKYNNFVVFDTETTGLSAAKDKILEIGAIRFENGIPVAAFETLVNPGKPIPEEASSINHITDDMVANAPAIWQVLPAFDAFVGKSAVVAHNLKFDLKFIHRSGSKLIDTKRKYYCTYEQSKRLLKGPTYRNGEMTDKDYDVYDHKLGTLCEYYHIFQPDQHRAVADAFVTGKLFLKLVGEKQ